MTRDRGWRRGQGKRVQRSRKDKWGSVGWSPSVRHEGMMKDTNFSCSCVMCNPHKHGLDSQYSPSEQRRLQEEE